VFGFVAELCDYTYQWLVLIANCNRGLMYGNVLHWYGWCLFETWSWL